MKLTRSPTVTCGKSFGCKYAFSQISHLWDTYWSCWPTKLAAISYAPWQWLQYGSCTIFVHELTSFLLKDLKDERRRDDIAAARATLKKNSIMLLTTSKVMQRMILLVLCCFVIFFNYCASVTVIFCFPSVLWHCWLGDGKGIWPVKSWVLVCWWWRFDWSFAGLIAPVVTTASVILSSNNV